MHLILRIRGEERSCVGFMGRKIILNSLVGKWERKSKKLSGYYNGGSGEKLVIAVDVRKKDEWCKNDEDHNNEKCNKGQHVVR